LRTAIASVFSQSFQDFELIIVNDGSTDPATLQILAELDDCCQVIHQSNQGQGTARNHALNLAKGQYIAFLDSDDHWFPHTLQVYSSIILRYSPAVCFASHLDFSGTASLIYTGSDMISCEQFEDFASFYRATSLNIFLPGCFCIQSACLGLANRFLEGRINSEDLHLILKLASQKGFVNVMAPPVLAYRQHALSSTKDLSRGEQGIRELYRRRRQKHYPYFSNHPLILARILTSHVRSASIELLRLHHYRSALRLYVLGFLDNLLIIRLRYLMGFWVVYLFSLRKRV
jgi:glycosyltransferase involved in cell wall biosynthesis